jgi:hypothetical protein
MTLMILMSKMKVPKNRRMTELMTLGALKNKITMQMIAKIQVRDRKTN